LAAGWREKVWVEPEEVMFKDNPPLVEVAKVWEALVKPFRLVMAEVKYDPAGWKVEEA
jgi:hypothetical protein